jgi:hypothetical protein
MESCIGYEALLHAFHLAHLPVRIAEVKVFFKLKFL